MSEITEILSDIQQNLKAPKGQFNSFGKYKYRSCEDIVEAVKPLLAKHNAVLVLFDDIINLGDRYYVKAVAQISNGKEVLETSAYARESESKKGMDESQITGTASSYARKYALNGLFAIDDTKDADTNEHKDTVDKSPTVKIDPKAKKEFHEQVLKALENGDDSHMKELWSEWDADEKAVLWGMFNSQQRSTMKEMTK